jgi:hypothetical protein
MQRLHLTAQISWSFSMTLRLPWQFFCWIKARLRVSFMLWEFTDDVVVEPIRIQEEQYRNRCDNHRYRYPERVTQLEGQKQEEQGGINHPGLGHLLLTAIVARANRLKKTSHPMWPGSGWW